MMDVDELNSLTSASPSMSIGEEQGYPLDIADEPVDAKFLCTHCKLIMRQPMQNQCGHRFCKNCIHAVAQSGEDGNVKCVECVAEDAESEYSFIQLDQSFSDNALKREMWMLAVHCVNGACPWKGKFKDYDQKHCKECDYRGVTCEYCNKQVSKALLQEHYNVCPEVSVECDLCGKRNVLRKNLLVHQDPARQECKPTMADPGLASKLFHRLSTVEKRVDNLEQTQVKAQVQLSHSLSTNESVPSTSRTPTDADVNNADINSITKTLDMLTARLQTAEDIQQVLSDEIEAGTQRTAQLEKELKTKSDDAVSYTGKFIWRLTDVKRRHAEARSEVHKGIYSPPFYTSPTGYKMCLRLFLFGDGPGKSSHLSVFFVLLKGDYDALLPWPFKQRVTIMLLDQEFKEDIIDSFVPDRQNKCFNRPEKGHNIGTGYPMFAPLSYLDTQTYGYIKDDTMFIKVIVDTTGLDDAR